MKFLLPFYIWPIFRLLSPAALLDVGELREAEVQQAAHPGLVLVARALLARQDAAQVHHLLQPRQAGLVSGGGECPILRFPGEVLYHCFQCQKYF